MPGPSEPGYNVLTPPKTRAQKAWFNFWRSVTVYNRDRNANTAKYIKAIRRTMR
jgi:hypothetical protein